MIKQTANKSGKHIHQFDFLFNEPETDRRYARVFILCKCGEVHQLRFEGDRIHRAISKLEDNHDHI